MSFGFDQEAKTNIDISRNLEIPSKDVKKIKNTALQKITDNQDKLQYYIEAMQQRDENN
ncbi:hypothetical protein FACS1894166_07910 [Bacilli bacterium]|nr:hypothetical protein FACS1894166_07910 [Bacilli bacterium]